MIEIARPTFLLGVGAQKAGTTWLHRYLLGDPATARAAMKEFHVWSALVPVPGEPSVTIEGRDAPGKQRLRQSMIADPDQYFEYFAGLLGKPGKRIVTDITPAYAGLPADVFERIRTTFEQRGIRTKVVFLMRDPVERCWSAVRMYRKKGLSVPGVSDTADEEDAVRAYGDSLHAQRRGRYDLTVGALEQAFPADDLYFGFHETLVDAVSIADFSRFAGLKPRPQAAAERFNTSPKHTALSIDTQLHVREAYSKTLEFCVRRFPRTRELWPSAQRHHVSGGLRDDIR